MAKPISQSQAKYECTPASPSTERVEQEGCHNCKHVFVRDNIDEQLQYVCTLNAPPRPSDWLHFPESETFTQPLEVLETLPYKKTPWGIWNAWAEGRKVNPWTICNAHERNFETVVFGITTNGVTEYNIMVKPCQNPSN